MHLCILIWVAMAEQKVEVCVHPQALRLPRFAGNPSSERGVGVSSAEPMA